ncbi:hypothetical protein COY87_01770 [Candidatus Roizmanbacteria bacterium CG_4_10_14_0_8_um_filter_33_9]|uniref:Glycosyltransferase RgtA/B/C/D-like domain-containing protein n=1 Tax=Candidatus Roizmanbacteria bacterium CG_4_10_14_0_8_um_filter_33_9 TaxID=1974826 RepID=A0A2M7QK36_9BACT|nr:MAG: hypothetical protein COY87_01770 [Candidatus Roizmanbacteria bacterium CG_4_10_14_0_8_um_filter_33_9]
MPLFDKNISTIYNVMEVASNDNNLPNFSKIKTAREQNIYFNTLYKSTPLTYQAHHPPLYHFLGSLLFRISDTLFHNLIFIYYSVRLISTAFYFLTIYVVWHISIQLIKNKKIADYLTVVFAINPVALKMGIAINPDIAATALALSILLAFLAVRKKAITKDFLILITVFLTIGTYVKFQNIVFFPFAFLVFLLRGVQEKKVRTYIIKGFMVCLSGLMLFLPWMIHSYITTQSITPSSVVYTFFCTQNNPQFTWYVIPFQALLEFRHPISHFAGFVGWGEPYPFKPFFIMYTIIFSLFLVLGIMKTITSKQKEWITYLIPHMTFILLFFLGVSLTYKINRYSCDIQGRYLLTALFPFFLLIFQGISSIFKTKRETVAHIMFLFSIWQFLFILCYVLIPRYYV